MKNKIILLLLVSVFFTACKTAKTTSKKSKELSQAAILSQKLGDMFDRLVTDLKQTLSGEVDAYRTATGVDITIDAGLSFNTGADLLTPYAKNKLEKVADVLGKYPHTSILVEGHADSTGTDIKNRQLSERRAKNTALYLKSKGVEAGRLKAIGYGSSRPVASNATAEGRTKNRRVVLKINADEKAFSEAETSKEQTKK